MPRNLIIVTALAVVALLSVAWLFLMGPLSSSSQGKNDVEAKAAELLLLLESAGIDAKASHVRIKPFNISIIQAGKIHGALYVSMDLETGSRFLNADVVKFRPKLRDAYLQTLSRYANNQMDPNKPVNIFLLKRLLQRATDRILGADSVTVIISAAHVSQPIR